MDIHENELQFVLQQLKGAGQLTEDTLQNMFRGRDTTRGAGVDRC